MSEEPLANKTQLPPAMPDAEYDVIYATVSETAQGRRFLEEYARRVRPSDTETTLAAIERMHAATRGDEADGKLNLLLEMAEMAQAIVKVRAEIGAIKTPPGPGPSDAMEELDSIVHATEAATSRILAAAEQMQEIAWTLRESGSNPALCDLLDTQATEIYTACSFQDLTGQRTRKVIQVLRYLEDRINATVTDWDKAEPAALDLSAVGTLVQADVDAMMQPPAATPRDDRQDATLEDISRLMLQLEPTMTFREDAAEEPVEQPDANIVHPPIEDVRPELSVSEAVKAEADAALQLAEWSVETTASKAPTQAKPADEFTPPQTDWIVEDPSAPQPDAEPAWMILQRMEAGPDKHREAEAEASNFVPSPPIPAIPAVPIMAEAPFFVAEDMSQLVATLQPPALLPPPELSFRTARSADPLAELETAIAATRMRLLQPGEDAEAEAAPEPQEEAAASNPLAEMQADLPSPAPAAASELMKRAAATVIGRAPFGIVPSAEIFPAVESDADDFLFAPEMQNQQHDPADFLLEPAPQETPRYTPPEPEPREPEWESGTYPDLALVTPQTVEASEPAQPKQARPHSDSLAPLRALSEAQKIALFS